jgi:hypothetical protein
MATLGAVLAWGITLSAQDTSRAGGLPIGGGGLPRAIDILGVEPLELGEPVLGAPFSADTITDIVQQLADGNQIERRTTGSIARDRRGRIRNEQMLAGFGPSAPAEALRIVTITDPVRREQHRLDEARNIAWRLRLPPAPPSGREMLLNERAPLQQLQQSMRTEPLEPMLFDGVKADGRRVTLVLPPGAIGNERAIDVISERWYSSELRVVVATRRLDPRFGDVTYKLVNIVRADPPPQRFEVPTDFRVREEPSFNFPVR